MTRLMIVILSEAKDLGGGTSAPTEHPLPDPSLAALAQDDIRNGPRSSDPDRASVPNSVPRLILEDDRASRRHPSASHHPPNSVPPDIHCNSRAARIARHA
jgi:hypothetical protein